VVVAIALVVAMGVVSVVAPSDNDARADTAILGAGGEFHPLTPTRILDTRFGINDVDKSGVKKMTRGQGTDRTNLFEVQVLGQGGLPPDVGQVLAVAVNVTIVQPTQRGYARVFGSGATESISSLVNFEAGEIVPNGTIVRPGDNGKLAVRLVAGGGEAHVLIDVFGYFSTSSFGTRGARLIPVEPSRRYDSRDTGQPLGRDGRVQLPMLNRNSIPFDQNVVGVLVNVTGVNTLPRSTSTFVSVLPTAPPAGQRPTTSNLNLRAGQIKPNTVLVPVGKDGAIHLFNANGETHVVVDVLGYLMKNRPLDSRAGRVIPLSAPFRVLDTREVAFGAAPLPPGKGEDWSFANFANDVRIPLPGGGSQLVGKQSAVIGNFTATDLQRPTGWYTPVSTFLTAYPSPPDNVVAPPPLVSNLNLGEGQSVPNLALFRYRGSGTDPYQVRVYNHNGLVHYLFDATAVVLAD
jgi:hypothetical protein